MSIEREPLVRFSHGCCRLLSLVAAHEFQGLLWLRDLGHGGLGEEAAALQLPFFLLLLQLAANQSHDRRVVGEDADHVGAAFDGQLR